jgi:hypothetical protein
MNGMEMMFKTMGIDVEAIKKVISPESVKQTFEALNDATQTMKRIEQQNETMYDLLVSAHNRFTRIEMKLGTMPEDELQKLVYGSQHQFDANPVRVEQETT